MEVIKQLMKYQSASPLLVDSSESPFVENKHNETEATNNPSQPVWICLYFPRIALYAHQITPGNPSIVIEEIKGKQLVHTACEIAMQQGVMPGMPLNAAYVLCRNLIILKRNPAKEKAQLNCFAERAMSFTPNIYLPSEDMVLLEVSKSLRLFNGFVSLHTAIKSVFSEGSIISCAPCSTAAILLAQNAQETPIYDKSALKSVLGELPINNTGLEQKLVKQLANCGLKTLRDLWRLPTADLARRFGNPLVSFLDHACANQITPLKPITAQCTFNQQIELPAETSNHQLIVIALERLLMKAEGFLKKRAAATECMKILLHHTNRQTHSHPATTLHIHSQQADRSRNRFLPQLVEKLDRIILPDPVHAVTLIVDHIIPFSKNSESLFSNTHTHQQDWQQLIDVVAARLGAEMIYHVYPKSDHRPEKAWQPHPVDTVTKPASLKIEQHIPVNSRPLWLLQTPKKLTCANACISLESKADCHKTERIESGWWEQRDISRDYYVTDNNNHYKSWIYKDRDHVKEPEAWYLHGVYG